MQKKFEKDLFCLSLNRIVSPLNKRPACLIEKPSNPFYYFLLFGIILSYGENAGFSLYSVGYVTGFGCAI